ncbi:helix-turn-helix domain-containing protein [Streptomyces sp. NPDC056652]|uniref:helix-turn-helix domain-containing protein n=1 Tax=Streptomyces sp. NPDC056652 TaxID=3345893 RepID=UPI003697A1F2
MIPSPKPGVKADRDALRHEMSSAGCSTPEIAIEMRVRFRIRPREAWRHALGWTLQGTAERISSCPGSAVAADASLVGKWEKWPGPSSRRPTLHVLVVLATVYGCDVEDLLDIADRRALPDSDLRIIRSRTPEQAITATTDGAVITPEAESDRVVAAATESATWAQWAEATNVGDIALEQVFADVRTLACQYLNGDAVVLFNRTRRLRDRVFALLEGHQPPRQSADLYVSAGYLCGLLAWISSDLGNLRAADTQGRTAWLCAEMAGHSELSAWVASTRSKIAFWDGRLRDAINYARRGTACRPRGSVGALLACQEADAWSKLGAAEETRSALRRAAAAREAIVGSDEIGGLFSCNPARQENYAAAAHLRIGAYHEALREADTALGHLAAHYPRAGGTAAQIHVSRATALTGIGHPDAVMEALAPVLALPPELRFAPITERMRDLGELMAAVPSATSPVPAAARRALNEWCLDSAPRRFALSSGDGTADWISGHDHST